MGARAVPIPPVARAPALQRVSTLAPGGTCAVGEGGRGGGGRVDEGRRPGGPRGGGGRGRGGPRPPARRRRRGAPRRPGARGGGGGGAGPAVSIDCHDLPGARIRGARRRR